MSQLDVAAHSTGPTQTLLLPDDPHNRTLGRIRTVPATVRVSGRRFAARPVHYTVLVNLFPLLYRLGVPPGILAGFYGAPR